MAQSKSKNMCCVVNCSNTYKTSKHLKFFSFPNRQYEQELKKKWIRAVNRLEENGKLWMPTTRSLICSDHFVGNIRSKDPQSPSYIPSIFPKMYNKPKPNTDQQINRYNRSRNRSELRNSKAMNDSTINTFDVDITDINVNQHSNLNTKCDVSTQVSLNISGNDNFIFECIQNKNNVNTQVSVPKSFDNNFSKPCLLDKMCGPDSSEISYLSRESFKGFESITNEKRLISLTGTSFFT